MTSIDQLLPPGFRFHPTDEELILHYLKSRAASIPCPVSIIAEVDIYKFDPWELPAKATFGEKEWYFFSPRDRKYPNGVRPNRAAGSGYWKATGTDKPILTTRSGKAENIGVKKALVFYKGKPPKGSKTSWIMHEYRLAETSNTNTNLHLRYSPPTKNKENSMRLDDWVLCRIYQKHNNNMETPATEVNSGPVSFMDMSCNQQSRVQMPDDIFSETDYSVLSRLLQESQPDMLGQDQLLSNFSVNPAVNQPHLNGVDCMNYMNLPVTSTSVDGRGMKRMRVSGGIMNPEEDDSYLWKSYVDSESNGSRLVSPNETSQLGAINQSCWLNYPFSF